MPRGKKNAIQQLINDKYASGAEITIAQLAEEVGCTVQNVYIYIRKNPTRFTKVHRGLYKINPSMPASNGSSSQVSSITNDEFYDSKTMEA
jgi:hypothetical protein